MSRLQPAYVAETGTSIAGSGAGSLAAALTPSTLLTTNPRTIGTSSSPTTTKTTRCPLAIKPASCANTPSGSKLVTTTIVLPHGNRAVPARNVRPNATVEYGEIFASPSSSRGNCAGPRPGGIRNA